MNLLEIGSWAYQVGAIGILGFTAVFLFTVRWWSDLLGRVLAYVFSIMSLVLLLSAYRSLTGDVSRGFLFVRLVVYWAYGVGVWVGLGSFVWFQFFAPRVKQRTTRRKVHREEMDLAGTRGDRNGDPHDDPSGDR